MVEIISGLDFKPILAQVTWYRARIAWGNFWLKLLLETRSWKDWL